MDLSAGRSYAAEIVIAATSSPGLINVTTRWLVFHRWTRQHIVAANGLVFGERGLLDIGESHGRERDRFIDDIRFVRTAIVDPNAPDLAGLRPPQLAWLREANKGLQRLAAELDVGRSAMLGAVPLDPVLQWREQLITDSDVWARHVANQATIEAFDSIAKNDGRRVGVGTTVSEVRTEFLEISADFKVESLPLSHVSVEIGHLYMEDLRRGRDRRPAHFRRRGAMGPCSADPAGNRLREGISPGQHVLPHRRLLQPVLFPGRGDPDGASRGGTGRAARSTTWRASQHARMRTASARLTLRWGAW